MRFQAFIYESVFLPYTVSLSAESVETALAECSEIDRSKELLTPVMIIDHQEKKAWRIGKSEDGLYLSDTAAQRLGMGTTAEVIAHMEAEC
jgi:hypothetical protein